MIVFNSMWVMRLLTQIHYVATPQIHVLNVYVQKTPNPIIAQLFT